MTADDDGGGVAASTTHGPRPTPNPNVATYTPPPPTSQPPLPCSQSSVSLLDLSDVLKHTSSTATTDAATATASGALELVISASPTVATMATMASIATGQLLEGHAALGSNTRVVSKVAKDDGTEVVTIDQATLGAIPGGTPLTFKTEHRFPELAGETLG